MRRDPRVLLGICVLLAAPAAMGQSDPQRPEVLGAAMTQQTYLKVLVLCGYYDVATPFNGIENTFARMNLEPAGA